MSEFSGDALDDTNREPKNWKRVEELFLAAVELPEGERCAYLESQCGGDAALMGEVESLLSYDKRGERPIPDTVKMAAASVLGRKSRAGERVGPYRLTAEIGSGGMATVHLAARDDDQFRQLVAVKLIRSEAATGMLLDRFRHERQILAGLEHPYIARLLDGGTTMDGAPYLVMEYVEGMPVDAYCEEHGLTIEQRCELFCRVCEAVSYAHRKLVVHRDLKPGNLIVTREGAPKLLDFGIAKLMTPDGSLTHYGQGGSMVWSMTPDYASPEQVRGESVSTASDVYSLGALLYQLLTSVKPHQLANYTPVEVERVVCREEPLRPSLAVKRAGWSKRLAGDLDNIVQMAMRKEPDRRYESVDRLAGDVRRHLTGRPVTAREDTLGYRAGKFLRRHRISVSAATIAVAGLAAAAALAMWQAREAGRAQARAERSMRQEETAHREAQIERDRAMAASRSALARAEETEAARLLAEKRLNELVTLANRSVFEIQGAIEKLPGATEARQKIAKTTAEFLDLLAKETGGDVGVRRVLAQAYIRLGDVQGMPTRASLGDTAGAAESYRKAESILAQLRRAAPFDDELRMRVVEVRYRQGMALLRLSETGEGVRRLEAALEVARALAGARPNDVPVLELEGAIEQSLARALVQVNLTRAAEFAEAQLKTYRALAARAPANEAAMQGLATAYTMRGSTAAQLGRIEEALEDARHSAELREQLAARHPNDTELQRNLMLVYGHIGDRLGSPLVPNLGRPREARPYFEKARKLAEAMVAADGSNRLVRRDLAAISLRLGMVAGSAEERAESLAALRQAVAINEEHLKGDPRNASLQLDLATAHEFIGTRLLESGDAAAALASYRTSLSAAEQLAAADPKYASARHQIMAGYHGSASALARQGDREAALAQIDVARAAAQRLIREGPNPRAMQRYPAMVESWAGEVLETLAADSRTAEAERMGLWSGAREAYARSLELWSRVETSLRSFPPGAQARVAQRLAYCVERMAAASAPAR